MCKQGKERNEKKKGSQERKYNEERLTKVVDQKEVNKIMQERNKINTIKS